MKAFLTFLFISITLLLPLNAQQAENHFSAANAAYQAGEFNKAITEYEAIITGGKVSGALYYNLGNAYYKLNKIGPARLMYERAKLFLNGDEALAHNMDMLKARLSDQIEPTPKFILTEKWHNTLEKLSFQLLTYSNLTLFILLLIIAALFLHTLRRGNAKLKPIMVVVLFLWIGSTVLWISKVAYDKDRNEAIVLALSVTAHAEPDKNSTDLFVIHEGIKINVLRNSNGWAEIILEDGKTGWIPMHVYELIQT